MIGVLHLSRVLADKYAYGLPEVGTNRVNVRQSRLIANPGCYATAAQLGLVSEIECAGTSFTSNLVAIGSSRLD